MAIEENWRSTINEVATIADPLKMRAETYTRQAQSAPASNKYLILAHRGQLSSSKAGDANVRCMGIYQDFGHLSLPNIKQLKSNYFTITGKIF